MHFGHSFTQQWCIEGLKMQTFKKRFQSARFDLTLLNSQGREGYVAKPCFSEFAQVIVHYSFSCLSKLTDAQTLRSIPFIIISCETITFKGLDLS